MAWNTLRKATQEERHAITAAAERFCSRHLGGWDGFDSPTVAVDCATTEKSDDGKRLNRLWLRIVRRILGKQADGIAYGYVGYHGK